MPHRGPTGPHSRVLQIHPTRRCNLACAHCYSGSGPGARDVIDERTLHALIADAAAEGFRVIGVSGGEPLLYEPLVRVLEHAKRLGLITTVTSNGGLLDDRAAARLAAVADLVAISVDGGRAQHDRLRRSPGSFDAAIAAGRRLKRAGVKFGFITTVTRQTLPELEFVAALAVESGAALFQTHALEQVGRGTQLHSREGLSEREMTIMYLEIERLRGRYPALAIQCDLADAVALRAVPERALATDLLETDVLLADVIAPIVLEPDGVLVPLQYGFDRRFAFGPIARTLPALKREWMARIFPAFTDVCRSVFQALPADNEDWAIVNWFNRTRAAAVANGSVFRRQ